jgi:flap endonuclease-1
VILLGVDLKEFSDPKPISWSQLNNKVLAIDSYNTLYQFLSSIRQADGTPLMDTQGRLTGHLTGLFYRTIKWLEVGIRPVFVFDGTPPDLKRKTLDERRLRKEEAEKKRLAAVDLGDDELAKRYAQQTSKLTSDMAEQAKMLLKALGIPTIQAHSEGEAEAADLVKRQLCWASCSQDFDSLLFGCPALVRNLSTSGRRKVPRKNEWMDIEPEIINLKPILERLKIDRKQLIWMALLIGTDFNKGVYKVGPKKALKLIKENKTFEQIMGNLPDSAKEKKTADGEIMGLESWQQIESFFLNPPTTKIEMINHGCIDEVKTIELLCEEYDFSKDRVERTLSAYLKKKKETGGQTTLGEW